MTTTRERHPRLERAMGVVGIVAGMAMVAVLGYGGDCGTSTSSPETAQPPDNNAATGYLLHNKSNDRNGPDGFECKFRCVATLISWNVIATSLTCLEMYQRTYGGYTADDNAWAFGFNNVCEKKKNLQLVHDEFRHHFQKEYHSNTDSKSTPLRSLYRVWRTIKVPPGNFTDTPDIRKQGDMVLMILDRPANGVQPFEIPGKGATIPMSDHGDNFKYQEPWFRLVAYTPQGTKPIQATSVKQYPPEEDIKPIQDKTTEKYIYKDVHHGESCKDAPGLKWVYPDFRAKHHTTLKDNGVFFNTNDNFLGKQYAIGFVGSPVLQKTMFWGVIAGYGNAWNGSGCEVSSAYNQFDNLLRGFSPLLGAIAGLIAGVILSFIFPWIASGVASTIGFVTRVATFLPRLANIGKSVWNRSSTNPRWRPTPLANYVMGRLGNSSRGTSIRMSHPWPTRGSMSSGN